MKYVLVVELVILIFGLWFCGFWIVKTRGEIREQGLLINRIRNALFDKFGTGIFRYTTDSADKQEIMHVADLISIPKQNRSDIELLLHYFKLIKRYTPKKITTKPGIMELIKKQPKKKTQKARRRPHR